jgi:NAD+ synthase
MNYKLSRTQISRTVQLGARALADYCIANDIHYVVTGSSGGLDSAVMLGFAREACRLAKGKKFKLTSVGLIMPCESHPDAERLGRKAIDKFGAKKIRINLSPALNLATEIGSDVNSQIIGILNDTNGRKAINEWNYSLKIAKGNIKARLRMMFGTYHVARMMKGMVLSTDNLSEFWMAFWTICGDVGDFGIIQQMLKGLELYDVARYLGVPAEIIAAKPDDGLGIDSGDEAQLGASYPVLDRIMIQLIQAGFDPDGPREQLNSLPKIEEDIPGSVVRKLATRAINGAFKRHGTFILSREQLELPVIEDIKL